MKCPKCDNQNTQKINNKGSAFHCIECNHSWRVGKENSEPKGDLSFNGVPEAKKMFEILTKDQDLSPELRAAIEVQITAMLFDQWFEGMKTGKMASILYAKEYYGKERNGSNGAANSRKGRTDGAQRPGQDRRIRRSQDTANPTAGDINPTVTERINGGTLKYPRGIRVPDNMFTEIAKMIEELPGFMAKDYFWDGHKLTVGVDW